MASSAALHEDASRPALQIGPVLEAARAALRPPGPVRWIIEPRGDHVEVRTIVRRWSTAVEPSARLARVACGTALRAARLAVAVQDRRPVLSHPEQQPGLLAVLHAGDVVAPRPEDLLLHALLRHVIPSASYRARRLDRTAAVRRLRRAAEAEGAWLRVLPAMPSPSVALGPCWQDPDEPPPDRTACTTIVALLGAPGRVPAADLRAGQAVETVRLTAMALGLDMQVLAAPVAPTAPGIARAVGPGTDTLALVQVRWPNDSRPMTTNEPPTRRAP